ncbi:MAG: ribosomal protein S18-alanine N-acetyltransferase [Leptolyngbyaceae cyanobacterium RU_5_1]|nr:ribosomal protein S18-alanine N-acetyltransferase [Leptolyngbyaceae cyanobacterium RU_5_1]
MAILALQPLTADLLPAALVLDQHALGGFWTRDGYRREIDSPNSDLLALKGHSSLLTPHSSLLALGCSWAVLEEAHITLLAVDPRYQRQGLGQALLYGLLKAAHERGLERATLEVRVSNQAAILLYEKFGFREAGRRKRYYQDTGEDALVLWRGGLQYPDFCEELSGWQRQICDRLHQFSWQLNPDWDVCCNTPHQ